MPFLSAEKLTPTLVDTDLQRNSLNAAWLIRLRWSAITGQIIVMVVTWAWLGLVIPVGPIAITIAGQLAVNLIASRIQCRGEPIHSGVIATSLAADLVALTALLYFLGGPHNPFCFLYLVYVALAAVVLKPRAAWVLSWVAVMLLGLLYYGHRELSLPVSRAEYVALRLYGTWVAEVVATVFITYFVQRVTRALAAQDRALAEARAHRARWNTLWRSLPWPLGRPTNSRPHSQRSRSRRGRSSGPLSEASALRTRLRMPLSSGRR